METAIITGASSGIGTAITKELLLLGYKVFGFGRDFSMLLADLKEDKTYAPLLPNLTPITLDLTKTGTLAEKIREIRKNSEISLLVNNAGVGYFGLHEELNPSMLHEMVTVNLEVPMLLCQLLLRDLKKTGGHIIQISSVTAKKPANKSQVLLSRFQKYFINLFSGTTKRLALSPISSLYHSILLSFY